MRRSKALWQYASSAGLDSITVGWLNTWPAEPVRGAMVAPYVALNAHRQTTIKKCERWAQACFVCQQCADKALKALALARGFDRVRSHSTLEIARALGINDAVEDAAKRLDLYYMSTRYPDALLSGAPFEYFTRAQAEEALQLTATVLRRVREEVRWVAPSSNATREIHCAAGAHSSSTKSCGSGSAVVSRRRTSLAASPPRA